MDTNKSNSGLFNEPYMQVLNGIAYVEGGRDCVYVQLPIEMEMGNSVTFTFEVRYRKPIRVGAYIANEHRAITVKREPEGITVRLQGYEGVRIIEPGFDPIHPSRVIGEMCNIIRELDIYNLKPISFQRTAIRASRHMKRSRS